MRGQLPSRRPSPRVADRAAGAPTFALPTRGPHGCDFDGRSSRTTIVKDIAGHWWLPESSAIRVAGTLTRGADDRASLVLRGTLSESAGDVSNRTVLGLSDAAVPITIETDFETNRAHSSTRRGGNVIRQTVG